MSDEVEPARQPILASDAEREQSIVLLRDAVGEGRLTLEEFSERVDLAQVGHGTDGDLAELTRDLPSSGDLPSPHAWSTALDPAAEHHRAFCSHLTRNGPWSLPTRSAWRSIFGTIDLDLRQARLDGPETVVEVYNLFGTVTLIVPEGVEVIVRGGGLFASQKIDAPERPAIAGAPPRLTIDTSGPGGTLYVRTQPPSKRSIRDVLTR